MNAHRLILSALITLLYLAMMQDQPDRPPTEATRKGENERPRTASRSSRCASNLLPANG